MTIEMIYLLSKQASIISCSVIYFGHFVNAVIWVLISSLWKPRNPDEIDSLHDRRSLTINHDHLVVRQCKKLKASMSVWKSISNK